MAPPRPRSPAARPASPASQRGLVRRGAAAAPGTAARWLGLGGALALLACARPAPPLRPPPPPPVAAPPPAPPVAAPPPAGPLLGGAPVPLRSLDGRPGQLQDHAARVTVLGFWASFCRPCLRELPYLDALHRRHEGEGDVAVLAINVDEPGDRDKARAAVAPLGLSLPLLVDEQGAIRRRIGGLLGEAELDHELTLPLLLIIDGAGHVFSESGFAPGQAPAAYLEDKDRLIAQGRRGDLPHRPPRRAAEAPPGAIVRLNFPRLREGEIRARLPLVREQLLRMAPGLAEADLARLLDQAVAAMRRGGQVRLRLPR